MRTPPIYLLLTGLVMAAASVLSLVFLDPGGGRSDAQEARNPVGELAVGNMGEEPAVTPSRGSAEEPKTRRAGARNPERGSPRTPDSPNAGGQDGPTDGPEAPPSGPMRLSVPAMSRVDGVPVRTAPGDDTDALDSGLLHLKGTGLPWERGANVFIAGHRIGWPGTRSNLVFYDLHELRDGDEVILTDSGGREYRYRVYESFEVSPDRTEVADPVRGRSVVTLQTCTLPDYSRRIIVRAELEGPA